MATETRRAKRAAPRGKVQFAIEDDGKALSVHLDRQGFRRLLETLERLAETGESQVFQKSGRGRSKASEGGPDAPANLVFHIEGDR